MNGILRPFHQPSKKTGHLQILYGNLAHGQRQKSQTLQGCLMMSIWQLRLSVTVRSLPVMLKTLAMIMGRA